MGRKLTVLIICLVTAGLLLSSCGNSLDHIDLTVQHAGTENGQWTFGFGASQIIAPGHENGTGLIIAGYHTGIYADGYLQAPDNDYAQARALWLDAGSGGVLLIGIDCIALSSATVNSIRQRLQPLLQNTGCIHISIYATHTHAQPDTLGLWGSPGTDGKNPAYMEALEQAAVNAAADAIASLRSGNGYWGSIDIPGLLVDSRYPYIFDSNLYQLRFSSDKGHGVRLLFYSAHAESLRGDNRKLSRDYPGMLCDLVTEATGDDAMFFPGAVGGLVMTKVLSAPFDAQKNLQITAEALADHALAISPQEENPIAPQLAVGTAEFSIPMDNKLFMLYKFLGVLDSPVENAESASGYALRTELSILQMGELTVALIPGEIFPELVYGGGYGYAGDGYNPETLMEIAKKHGRNTLLIAGLANDELGYIVPPSDFLVNEVTPYLNSVTDYKGEDHYEETNSIGPEAADRIAHAFEALLDAMS